MTESFHLYLNGRRAALRRRSGLLRGQVSALDAWDWDAGAPSSLALAFATPPRRRSALHVVLGSALCRFGALALPPGLASVEEKAAVAGAHMQAQMGLSGADWTFTLDEAAGPDAKAMVCGVRRALLSRLGAAAAEHGLRLASVRPLVAGVWNGFEAARPAGQGADYALMALEDDAFTQLTARSGKLVSINSLLHRQEPELVARELKRMGLLMGGNSDAVRLALSPAMAGLGQAHADKLVTQAEAGIAGLQADFRDLLFLEEK